MPAFLPDQKSYSAPSKSQLVLRKLPHVTALFWMIKIIATTLGRGRGTPSHQGI
jgi:uncharacterized membrane-anchored protein